MTVLDTATAYPPVATDFQGLARLQAVARTHSPRASVEAAKQFEALFIQMMLKSMRDTVPKDGLFDSRPQQMYQGLYDQQLALNLAQGNGLGLRSLIERALDRTPGTRSTQPAPTGEVRVTPTPVARTQSAPLSVHIPSSSREFVQAMLPYAERAARRLGLNPKVLVAQAALETGWGKRIPRTHDGRSSHNLLGIKVGSGWDGERARVRTVEYRDGQLSRESASFRVYESPEDCFDDYARMIGSLPRYRDALAAADRPAAYLKALQHAGYATDPNYADKIQSLLKRSVFAAKSAISRVVSSISESGR